MVSLAQLIGKLLMLLATIIFLYFSVWLLGSQYISPDCFIHSFFPPLGVALYGPLFLLAGFITFIAIFLGRAISKMNKKK